MPKPPLNDGILSHPLLAPAAILLVIIASLGASINNGFVYDDLGAIVQNNRAHDPTELTTIFSSPYWTSTLYRPITTTAFAVLWSAGDGSPTPFHAANLAAMLATCLLLHQILKRSGSSPTACLLATLLFAVHPVHVEVVANGVGLAELLSSAFLLAGAVLTLRRPWRAGTGLLLGACALLAFLSKESGITALALIPLLWLVHSPGDNQVPQQTRREAILLLALFLVAGLAVRTSVLGGLSGEAPVRALADLDTVARAQTVLGVIPEWARLLVWPAALQADYGPPQIPIGGTFGWRHAVGVGILLGWGAALVVAVRRGARMVAAGLVWIPVALSPVSNLLFPTGILLAERTLFLPSIGLALIVAGLIDAVPRRGLTFGLAAVLITLGGLRSHSRVGVWRDQETFFDQIVIDGARSYRSWYSAGGYASRTGDRTQALNHFGVAWHLEQRDFRVAEEYGQALRAAGDHERAIAVLRKAFALEPNHEPLTSRLLESLMAAGKWDEGRELIAVVRSLSEEDAVRLERRFEMARSKVRPLRQ